MNEIIALLICGAAIAAIAIYQTTKVAKANKKAMAIEAENPRYRQRLVDLHREGKYEEIVEQYGKYQTSEIGELQVLGVAFFETGNHETGEKIYLKALAMEKMFYKNDLRLNLAKCWYRAQNYRKAIKYLQEIPFDHIEDLFKEDEYEILYLTGLAFHKLEMYDAAIEALQKLPLNKKSMTHELLDGIELLAECYELAGNKKMALKFYNKVLANDITREHLDEKIKALSA